MRTRTNNSGGIQGGISNGENIVFQVAFKPTATIGKPQQTVDIEGNAVTLAASGRHDPCVLVRAPCNCGGYGGTCAHRSSTPSACEILMQGQTNELLMDYGISPDETLEVCAGQIIVNYFRQMMSYKDGAKAGSDIEFVHQMRVTSRRLRTAMDNFVDCFPEKPFNKHYKKVKSITRTLGAVRDLDVLIARFQKHLETLPKAEQADIRRLIAHLQQEREDARKPMLTLFAKLEENSFERKFLTFFKP